MDIRFDAGLPIYQQLAEKLRNDIAEGIIAPGDAIPSENTLCAKYQISRVTVRKSIQLLTNEGLLVKRQGKGTFVAVSNFVESARAQGSFTLSCLQSGVRPSTEIVTCEKTTCSEDIAEDLHLESRDIILIKRIRYANDVPVIFETDYIPADGHAYLLDMPLKDASLLDAMRTHGHKVFGGYDDTIDIRRANDEQALWLKVKKKTPLLGIYQKVFDNENRAYQSNFRGGFRQRKQRDLH